MVKTTTFFPVQECLHVVQGSYPSDAVVKPFIQDQQNRYKKKIMNLKTAIRHWFLTNKTAKLDIFIGLYGLHHLLEHQVNL